MPDLMPVIARVCATVFEYETFVEGSKGDHYHVQYGRLPPGARYEYGWTCSCPAFQFRKQAECKHIAQVKSKRCAWGEEALCGDFPTRPKDGKCPRCKGPLKSVSVAV
jgi:SWIM zinc finger